MLLQVGDLGFYCFVVVIVQYYVECVFGQQVCYVVFVQFVVYLIGEGGQQFVGFVYVDVVDQVVLVVWFYQQQVLVFGVFGCGGDCVVDEFQCVGVVVQVGDWIVLQLFDQLWVDLLVVEYNLQVRFIFEGGVCEFYGGWEVVVVGVVCLQFDVLCGFFVVSVVVQQVFEFFCVVVVDEVEYWQVQQVVEIFVVECVQICFVGVYVYVVVDEGDWIGG